MRAWIIVVAAAIALAVVGLFVFTRSPGPEQPSEQEELVLPSGRTIEIPITITKQFFNPSTLDIRAGDTLILQFTAADLDHGVFVPAYAMAARVPLQQTVPVQFTANKRGTMTVLCNDGCDANVVLTINVA